MKKRWILILLCLAVLNGCTETPADERVLPSESTEAAEAVTEITDAEITALIDTYLLYERYTVYASDSMEMEPNYVEIDGRFFNKVTDPAYDTWEKWTAFVESVFCGDNLTSEMDRIVSEQRFTEVNGLTYCQAGSMGWYISSEYTYRITESTADRVVIEMTRRELNPGGEDLEHINIFALHLTENSWRIGEWLQ